MANACAFQFMKFGLQNYPLVPPNGGAYTFEPTLTYFAVSVHLMFAGPGRFALQPHFPSLKFLKAYTHPILSVFKDPVYADLSMLLLRVVTASLMIHHGLEKLQNPSGFAENVIAIYFPFLPGPPLFWTYLSASFELGGSFCITVGILVRPAAALLVGTMVNAVAFQLMANGLQNYPLIPASGAAAYTFEPSFAFFAICGYIALAGPGQFGLRFVSTAGTSVLPALDEDGLV